MVDHGEGQNRVGGHKEVKFSLAKLDLETFIAPPVPERRRRKQRRDVASPAERLVTAGSRLVSGGARLWDQVAARAPGAGALQSAWEDSARNLERAASDARAAAAATAQRAADAIRRTETAARRWPSEVVSALSSPFLRDNKQASQPLGFAWLGTQGETPRSPSSSPRTSSPESSPHPHSPSSTGKTPSSEFAIPEPSSSSRGSSVPAPGSGVAGRRWRRGGGGGGGGSPPAGGQRGGQDGAPGGAVRLVEDVNEEERVLISEVVIRDKDGNELEDSSLLRIAQAALKASKPNFAVTTSEVQQDIHRIIDTGYFVGCVPSAEDTRDGVRLTFKVELNQELKGVVCYGANILPTRIIQDAFREEYDKVINIQRLDRVLQVVNDWYRTRGLFAQVTDIEILSDGVMRVQMAEAEVNNITIRFLDKKTGEPREGKTKPETILRQLMTKKGQVYSLQQGRRDVETVFTMGIMEDVNLVPQPAGDTGMVDLTMNLVERKPGGLSAGGGVSASSMAQGGLLSSLVGSFAYSHRNAFGRNQKVNVSLERGQVDSLFRINYTDPWLEGDDNRTSRSINIQNSRSPELIHYEGRPQAGGPAAAPNNIMVNRLSASVDWSRPLLPKWSGTFGLNLQRARLRDQNGNPKLLDEFNSPLTHSGREYDQMFFGKLETVYTDSGDNGSSQLVVNMEQAVPLADGWMFFNRSNVRARQGLRLGPIRCIASFSGGTVFGDLAPHEAFPIGGANSVRGYDEGMVGSGRSYVVVSGELSVPLVGPLEGAVFADYGSDLGSGQQVPGDPAGHRMKPGRGYGYGVGVRLDSPLGPLRLEWALNDRRDLGSAGRFHFGIGYRN